MIWEENAILMVDINTVEEESNTSMVREEAWKCRENPLDLPLASPSDGAYIHCVSLYGENLRMFYSPVSPDKGIEAALSEKTQKIYCAESSDALHWTLLNGSAPVDFQQSPEQRISGIMQDPLDAEHPFKALVLARGRADQLEPGLFAKYPGNRRETNHPFASWFVKRIIQSRDGFRWTPMADPENEFLVNGAIEEPNLYRAGDGAFVISGQTVSQTDDIQCRKVKGWLTRDGKTAHRIPGSIFALPDHKVIIEPRFFAGSWVGSPWVQSHVGIFPARKGSSFVALTGYLYGAQGAETFAQTADIGLAAGGSGYIFNQVWPFRPFLRRGNMGEWDCGLMRQAALVDFKDKTLIFYTANNVGNAGDAMMHPGTAYVGRDRYGCRMVRVYRDYAAPRDREAFLILKPAALPQETELCANLSHVNEKRYLRFELRDENNRAIPGFELENCRPLSREGLRERILWENADPQTLHGRTVKICCHFHAPDCRFGNLDSPRLYAVYTGRG